MAEQFTIEFWGVRGTIPTPDKRMLRYGGQTSCVEVRCGDLTFVLDAGTGIVNFGRRRQPSHIHLLLSHTHIDHILGLCCMPQMFDQQFKADIWAGHLLPDMFITEALQQLISPPLFPVALEDVAAQLACHDFSAGHRLVHDDFVQQGVTIDTLPLNHPDRATGYRINYSGHSLCYITDIEHLRDNMDERLIEFVKDTDIFIYDSTYDDRQFDTYEGWGHSTWQQAMRLGKAANVGKIIMFHHDPQSTDEILDKRAEEMLEHYDYPAEIAREGMLFNLL